MKILKDLWAILVGAFWALVCLIILLTGFMMMIGFLSAPLLIALYLGHVIEAWCLPVWAPLVPDDSTCSAWLIR